MVRSIVAVVAGFVVVGLLIALAQAGVIAAFPAHFDAKGGTSHLGMLLLMQGYVAVAATFGGWLAARLAPTAPLRHALIVGALGVLVNVASAAMSWALYPSWAHVVGILTAMLWAWLGGTIRERQLAGTPASRSMAAA